MPSEYHYKAQIRYSYKVHTKVNITQAITRVQPPDTKAQKPIGKNGNVFLNQMQAHKPLVLEDFWLWKIKQSKIKFESLRAEMNILHAVKPYICLQQ